MRQTSAVTILSSCERRHGGWLSVPQRWWGGGASPSPARCEGSAVADGHSCTSTLKDLMAGVTLAWPPRHDCACPGLAARVAWGAGVSWSPPMGLGWPGWSGQVGQAAGQGKGRAAAVSPAPLHAPRPSSRGKRRSDIAVLGQWARALRNREQSQSFTPSTKKDYCPHTLALLKEHDPKNL